MSDRIRKLAQHYALVTEDKVGGLPIGHLAAVIRDFSAAILMTPDLTGENVSAVLKRLRFQVDFQRGYGSDDIRISRDDGDVLLATLTPPPEHSGTVQALREALEPVRKLLKDSDGAWPSTPWKVVPSDGKPIIASDRGGNLFRGYIATWQEAELIVGAVNALPSIFAALSTLPGSPSPESSHG